MFINYFIWLIMGALMGLLGHIFDFNKQKGLLVYLVVGTLAGFASAFAVNLVLWPSTSGEINLVALVLGAVIAYPAIRMIDFFFHL